MMRPVWESFFFHENLLQFIALCACTILVAYLLTELIGLCPTSNVQCRGKIIRPVYGYNLENGPHLWKELFPASRGNKQSPINIIPQNTVLVNTAAPLIFSHYTDAPTHLYLMNSGTTVVIQGSWPRTPPTLSGGAVGDEYQFQAAMFRWGLSDAEGSEHTLNYMAFPLELQVLHARVGPSSLPAPPLLAISYFFEITEMDNPYLDQVVLALQQVQYPGASTELTPFPLTWLCPPFTSRYFSYDGSLTFPPCTENVRWIVRPIASGISPRQAAAFRMLLGWDGPLHSNLRPVQSLFCRDVFYYADPPMHLPFQMPQDSQAAG